MKLRRSAFNLSSTYLTTCRMGQLIPAMCMECMPGDTIKMSAEALCRLTPLLAPLMHNVRLRFEFHKVPFRLLWDHWEDFITGGEDGKAVPVKPKIKIPEGGFPVGSLGDYLALPVNTDGDTVDALPFRAVNLIWNERYRNQNVQEERAISFDDGLDEITDTSLPSRNWERDYFTSCLPWAQRGDPMYLPLGTEAPVVGTTTSDGVNVGRMKHSFNWTSGGTSVASVGPFGNSWPSGVGTEQTDLGLKADLSKALATTPDEMRAIFQMNLWKQIMARGGARYIEMIFNQFGVESSDARLQRPEFLGGGSSYVSISEVLQTSSSDAKTPQGNMAGRGLALNSVPSFKTFCEEYCFIVGFVSLVPKTVYAQGLERMWTRETKWDYPFPVFDHLGEQKVLNREIKYTGTEWDNETFGFQGRYNEYRYPVSHVTGLMRTDYAFWHLARLFETDARPALNSEFVTCTPSMRISAVENEDNCVLEVLFHTKALRPLSKHARPGRIDHIR